MWGFYLHMCMGTTCMPGAYWVSVEGPKSPANGVTDGCEPWFESWESNWVLYQSSTSSDPLSHLSNLNAIIEVKKAYDPLDIKRVCVCICSAIWVSICLTCMVGSMWHLAMENLLQEDNMCPFYLHRRCDIRPVTLPRHTPRPHLIKRGMTKHLMKRTPGRTRQALTYSIPERTQST